ncbi:Alpha/Beta hydrolase protein [Amylostereum chailletii]|nr:Alpha/Beta hydrolase protein [Amylostereum chailletii]
MEKQTFNVGGIAVTAFSTPGVLSSSSPTAGNSNDSGVVVLFLLHGRTGSAAQFDPVAEDAVRYAAQKKMEKGGEGQRDLVVITFDHRNHGSRTVSARANQAWSKDADAHNERHAVDMYSIQTGTARDVSFLIDFLPAYLFPNDERAVREWVVAGVSLGGHSTWLVLKDDPRVRIGVPVIGCPDYLTLIQLRADSALGLPLGPPYMPASLRAHIARADPSSGASAVSGASNPFFGKRILVLSGAEDGLVPWTASGAFVEGLEVGAEGRKEVMLMEGVGHEFTEGMRGELWRFVWEEALSVRQTQ